MNLSHLSLATSSLALVALFAMSSAKAETVTCESSNGNYRECAVDTRGGVTLSRQLSSQGCWEGDTWGYDRNRIWVNNGCRAQFHVGSSTSSSGNGGGVAAAVAVALVGAAIIANKNKRDRDDDRDDGWSNGGNPRHTFRCESQNNRYTYCSTGGGRRGQVEIYRQISDRRCVYGRNWGTQGNQVWVNDGCRAEFAVY